MKHPRSLTLNISPEESYLPKRKVGTSSHRFSGFFVKLQVGIECIQILMPLDHITRFCFGEPHTSCIAGTSQELLG